MDVALLTAWAEVDEDRCQCGRPRAVHEGETWQDYRTGFTVCPAMEALDLAQARRAVTDDAVLEQARESGDAILARTRPDRSRTWSIWHIRESPPD